MFYKRKENKKGQIRFEVGECFKDPLTGKWRTATVSYYKDTSRARKLAELELKEKIENLIQVTSGLFESKSIKTFGELKVDWLNTWELSVKPQTVNRENLVLKRLSNIIGDDYLLSAITPLFLRYTLIQYIEKYDCSASTLQHIKSSLNRVFDHAVLYQILPYNPIQSVKVSVSRDKKREAKCRRDKKFLEIFELRAFFEELSKCRNPNYYDLAIVLLFTGIRIGESGGITEADFSEDQSILDINKSLQSHDLKVDEFFFDDTKTENSNRKIQLPQVAVDALKRAIERNRIFDEYMIQNPCKSFKKSESIFRTEYGSPITSHSFREIISRVEKELCEHCEERYGFKWTKHVTPHSFRHMHITYLQNGDSGVTLKEIMERVGHVHVETTMIYTHKTMDSQKESITALEKFAENNSFDFKELKMWKCKYSQIVYSEIQKHKSRKSMQFNLNEFRDLIGIQSSYSPSHISANILPKITKDIAKYVDSFSVITLRESGHKQIVTGYQMTWC